MIYVACIGDKYRSNIFIVGVYSTREKALKVAKKYLDYVRTGCTTTLYARYWAEGRRLDDENIR